MYDLSPEFEKAVKKRIKENLPQQKNVYYNISTGRPLDGEDDDNRKTSYIKRKAGVSTEVAKEIANYQDISKLELPDSKKSRAESLQGPTVDFMNICFIDLARAASRSVARVVFLDGRPQGTGFMVSSSLFLTNQHVIKDADDAKNFILEFNCEQDFKLNDQTKTKYSLDPNKFFKHSPQNELDFSLIAVGSKIQGPLELSEIGFLPLFDSDDKHVLSLFVNCIEHPNGNFKQLVVRENRLSARTPNTLIYSSDTLPGASGSPIFNDDWEVLALHHYGQPYRAILDQHDVDGGGLPANGNEGIRISSIVKFLAGSKDLSAAQLVLLQEALSFSFRQPSLIINDKKENLNQNLEKENKKTLNMIKESLNEKAIPQQNNSNGSVSFTVPLIISVKPGETEQAGRIIPPDSTELNIGNKNTQEESMVPDADYSNRTGYDRNFLGITLKMPELSEQQLLTAAKNLKNNSKLFKYQHFSIVMNSARKLAYFTAVNIDGASVVKINRTTGKVTRGPEAAEGREKWYDDNRINSNEVCHDDLYRKTEMSIFQRGHLVKRTDPSWGTEERAIKGQADTFHFLNCSPQHSKFNPNTTRWAGVENWITNQSDNDNIRVSVFSGPVFEDDDPEMGGLLIPKSFWKIVAWAEEGELKATGIIATQAMLLGAAREAVGRENFKDLPADLPADYHTSIKHIQEVTGLHFGKLLDADTFSEGEGLQPVPLRPLDQFNGNNWDIV